MGEWRVQRNYRVHIIIHLLKHVSAALLSILSACGILRRTVQSVASHFVHGCLPCTPEGEAHAGATHHLLLSLGGFITFAVPRQNQCLTLSSTAPSLPQVNHICMMHTGCRSRSMFFTGFNSLHRTAE